MADLKKLLVHVPSNLCDGFKNKYVNGTEETRNKSYDGKIVFLEKTQEIFTKGKIYSTSVIDFSSLQQLVSSLQGLVGNELPEGVTSTNIIDYIGEVKKELIGKESDDLTKDTIYGAKDYGIKAAYETKLELISLDSDKIPEAKTIYGAYNSAISYLIGSSYDLSSYETIYGTRAYAREIFPSVTASTGIKVSYSTLYGKTTYTVTNTGVTGVDEEYKYGIGLYQTLDGLVNVNVNIGKVASRDNNVVIGDTVYKAIDSTKTDLIGKSSDASTANTIYGAKKYADEAASKVAAQIPTLSAGNGISLEPSTLDGHPNIKISTSARVFYYQGNKTTVSALPSTGNKGDVWSVGTENAEGSTLYVWDGDEWINIGGPNGVTDVKTTSSHGVALAKNQGGEVYVNVIPGEIKENNGSVVTGGEVYKAVNGLIGHAYDTLSQDTIGGAKAYAISKARNAYNDAISYIIPYIIGYSHDASSYNTIWAAKNYANEAVAAKLPIVQGGTGITVNTTAYNGKTTFTVFNSVGAGISTTPSNGVALSKETSTSLVKVSVNPGKVASGNNNVVTGGTVYSYIDSLGGSKTSDNGAYVNVTVTTKGGQVSGVTVNETRSLIDRMNAVDTAVQSLEILGQTLNKNNTTLTIAKAQDALGISQENTAYSFNNTSSTSPSYINVGVTTNEGKVQKVCVTNTAEFNSLIYNVDSSIKTISGDSPYLSATKSGSGSSTTVALNLNETEVFNYVSDNVWETYTE